MTAELAAQPVIRSARPAPALGQARAPQLSLVLPEIEARGRDGSVFDRLPWLYAFCRERLFRDDTNLIAASLWPDGAPTDGAIMLELGCGPGFYARRLAARFPELQTVGIDSSAQQLAGARARAAALGLRRCHFEHGDARALARPPASVDATIATRLFTVVTQPERVVAEMYRVLRPGGRCFLAEPRDSLWTTLSLRLLRLVGRALIGRPSDGRGHREPTRTTILADGQLESLVRARPWSSIQLWHDARYQYAFCEKAFVGRVGSDG